LAPGRFYQSLLVRHGDGRRQVVKVFVVPAELDLLQVHLDDLAEVNQQVLHDEEHQLVLGSHVDLVQRTVIVRRPYAAWTLADLFGPVGGQAGPADGLWMDGRRLEAWETRWLAHQLATAVARLHAAGLFHGSLHPDNVLVDGALGLALADLAPFKPHALGGPDRDPTLLLHYYRAHQRPYIAPARLADDAAPADTAARQRADSHALAVMLAQLGVDDAAFARPVDAVVLPLLRHLAATHDLARAEPRLDDLALLARDDPDVARILGRFFVARVPHLAAEDDVLRVLRIVAALAHAPPPADLVYYLRALAAATMGRSAPLVRAAERLLGTAPPARPCDAQGLRTPGQALRFLAAEPATREARLRTAALLPAFLVWPEARVRRAALRRLAAIAAASDDVDRIALLGPLVQPSLGLGTGLFDLARVPPDALARLLPAPLTQELVDLVLRNAAQLPQLLQAVSPEDGRKLRALEPLLPRMAVRPAPPPLSRRIVGANPVPSADAFSPLVSPVDEAPADEVPHAVDPTAYRHFQLRRLPFQHQTYTDACACPAGAFFALTSDRRIEVWRSRDLRRQILPPPWLLVELEGPAVCALSGSHAYVWNSGTVTVFDLRLRRRAHEARCVRRPTAMRPVAQGLVVACGFALAFLPFGSQAAAWASEPQPLRHGAIRFLVLAREDVFAVTASATGVLSLWDTRYGLCLRSWRVPLDGTVSALSLVAPEEPGALAPPRLLLVMERGGRAVCMVVDLATATIAAATDPGLLGQPLLRDVQGDIEPDTYPEAAVAHHPDASWLLLAEPSGELRLCLQKALGLDLAPFRTGLPPQPLAQLCFLEPTSAESSRNLSVLRLTMEGSASVLECFK
jgi:hypothetical protein